MDAIDAREAFTAECPLCGEACCICENLCDIAEDFYDEEE
jgi:hypothetical protein